MIRNPPADAGAAGNVGLSLGGQDPLEKGRTTAPAFLPGESHGQRSLAGYGPQGHKESDTTEQLSTQAHGVGVYTRLHHSPIINADPASPLNEVM